MRTALLVSKETLNALVNIATLAVLVGLLFDCWDAIIANGTGNRGDGLRLCLARVPLQRVEALPATLAQARLTAQIRGAHSFAGNA